MARSCSGNDPSPGTTIHAIHRHDHFPVASLFCGRLSIEWPATSTGPLFDLINICWRPELQHEFFRLGLIATRRPFFDLNLPRRIVCVQNER
jgi:hypothetical protein